MRKFGVVVALALAIFAGALVAQAITSPAVTNVTVNKHTVFGDLTTNFVTVTLPAAYNGATLTASQVGMTNIVYVIPGMSSGGYLVRWQSSDSTLRVYATTGGSGTATFTGMPFTPTGTVSQPTFTVSHDPNNAADPLQLSGRVASSNVSDPNLPSDLTLTTGSPVGAPSFTGDAVTPQGTVALAGIGGATAEVAGGTNLSAETVDLIVFGTGM